MMAVSVIFIQISFVDVEYSLPIYIRHCPLRSVMDGGSLTEQLEIKIISKDIIIVNDIRTFFILWLTVLSGTSTNNNIGRKVLEI